MDSGNSCSLNSSSGGDDEYDSSRTESISALLNSSNNTHLNNIFSNSTQQQQPLPSPLHHHQQQLSSINFDHISNYLNPFSSRSPQTHHHQNSLLNLDMIWHKNSIRSEPNSINTTTTNNFLMGSTSSTQQQHDQYLGGNIHFSNPSSSSLSILQQSSPDNNNDHHKNGATGRVSSSDHHHQKTLIRNPKKRTRASRRAPTTVLTTDTSNFRAMVQEFTGIPAPPFSASTSTFSIKNRFDLFNTSSSTIKSGNSMQSPFLQLRPFPHKVHHHHQLPSNTTTTTNNNELGHSNEPSNLLNIHDHQNPILTFQSLLQPSNVPMFDHHDKSKDPSSSSTHHDNSSQLIRMGTGIEAFNRINTNTTSSSSNTNHGGGGGGGGGSGGDHTLFSNIVFTSNEMSLGINNNNNNDNNGDGDDHGNHHENTYLNSSLNVNHNYSQQRVIISSNTTTNTISCKVNFTAGSSSSSDFHTDNLGFDNNVEEGFNKR